jgi:hypothetical protein
MEVLIKSLITAMYHYEISDESNIQPDPAIVALSATVDILKDVTQEEKILLKNVLCDLIASHSDPEFREYCLDFIETYIDDHEGNWL